MKIPKISWYKKKSFFFLIIVLIIISIVSIYHANKPLPKGVSYEGNIHTVENVTFLQDLTYTDKNDEVQHVNQIFPRIYKAIENAEEFIVIDMFLFNSYYDENAKYPNISEQLTNKLIAQKKKQPSLKVIFISDEVNTTYNTHESKEFKKLKENGVEIIVTDLEKLRDPNWLYSGLWRTMFQWFGQEGYGWIQNPFAKEAPKVTVRSYLKLLNVKANHRKLVVTDQTSIISSANPHDASGYHSNIAFEIEGNIINDFIEVEKAVGEFSNSNVSFPKFIDQENTKGDIKVQLLTEGKIKRHMKKELDATKKGDEIWLAMFYLADRTAVDSLIDAAQRGVKVKIILDPNQNAFGNEKIGLPNLPVAAELEELGGKNMEIRWYNTDKEQFHTKLLYIKKERESMILGGSTNYTRRNLDDYNLEANIKIIAANDKDISLNVKQYFNKLWTNQNGEFTSPYEAYQDPVPIVKYVGYLFQKFLRFETY